MKFKYLFFLILTCNILHSQNTDNNLIFWNSSKKLTIDDFVIKNNSENEMSSQGAFIIDSTVKGFDVFNKNFNKKVRNYMVKSASWINPSKNIQFSLRYQQTLFDISEIYARKFRLDLKLKRKELLKGFKILEDLNQKAVTDLSNRKLLYDLETNFGQIEDKQIEWEKVISKELEELNEYTY